jgi:hypothetical protein
MMYNNTDLVEARNQLLKMVLLVLGIFLVIFIPSVAFLLRKPQWMGASVLTAGVCIATFLWGVWGTPTYYYYRFVKDINEGRNREMSGRVFKVEERPVYKDNRLLYYQIWVVDDEDGEERILLYDDNKGIPPIQADRNYTFRIHENFIIQIIES